MAKMQTTHKVLLGLGIGAAAYYGYKHFTKKPKALGNKSAACLTGIYQSDAGFGDYIRGDLAAGVELPPDDAISITEANQKLAWELATLAASQKEAPSEAKGKEIKDLVSKLAPECDWSQGLAPYKGDSPQAQIWTSAANLIDLATQNLMAKGHWS